MRLALVWMFTSLSLKKQTIAIKIYEKSFKMCSAVIYCQGLIFNDFPSRITNMTLMNAEKGIPLPFQQAHFEKNPFQFSTRKKLVIIFKWRKNMMQSDTIKS